MSEYPARVTKSENIYTLWESGEGNIGELAIGLYDLTAHYKELWDDYAELEAENERLKNPFWVKSIRSGYTIMVGNVDVVWYVLENEAQEKADKLNATLEAKW